MRTHAARAAPGKIRAESLGRRPRHRPSAAPLRAAGKIAQIGCRAAQARPGRCSDAVGRSGSA
eukprot:CAMPEP_0203963790 /NCGR_PEP_ID=MMETSP0359-20131031/93670_1 /ASSEMBLY_ACC=CAM_ASM_000338 /TAXON_ID=268821 /ORGANISM="Scrippsiella Hangoei, Strain SHTV-5" /LENGTH=62 /DNA_ID=CAMNT_0050899829 /DNA_START=1 /DNA_END=185 /DNA_ORIENTATION=-